MLKCLLCVEIIVWECDFRMPIIAINSVFNIRLFIFSLDNNKSWFNLNYNLRLLL
jgi:hypothetical protein